jgi:hypothetical protein
MGCDERRNKALQANYESAKRPYTQADRKPDTTLVGLVIIINGSDNGRTRSMTWAISGLPANFTKLLSLPIRLDSRLPEWQ